MAAASTFSGDCLRDLSAVGVTSGQVSEYAGSVNVLNGWGSQANYATTIFGNSPAYAANAAKFGSMTVGQYFSTHPGTVAVAQANGHDVYIDATWVNSLSATDTTALLLHELLHNITGNVDDVLQQQLNTVLPMDQQLVVGAASQNIADALARDCVRP